MVLVGHFKYIYLLHRLIFNTFNPHNVAFPGIKILSNRYLSDWRVYSRIGSNL